VELVSRRLTAASEDYEARYGKRKNDEVIVQSSGNVFADLGLHDAGEKQTRVRLAVAINQIIQARHLSQTAAARLLDINQPKISALVNYWFRQLDLAPFDLFIWLHPLW